jgi:osmotically-inducible protein OsmY
MTQMSPHQQTIATPTRPNPFALLFQEIAEAAQAVLRQSAYLELHSVSCDFSGGVLTLRGRVPTYYLKQLAQASVADVPGVIEIHNRVEVAVPHELRNSTADWREHKMLASA